MAASTSSLVSSLAGDQEIAERFSAEADAEAMLAFEAALAEASAEVGLISPDTAHAIAASARAMRPDMDAIRAGLAQDGVAIPELVRQLRRSVGEPHAAGVHLGATSQDAIDTSLMLRLKPTLSSLGARLERLVALVDEILASQGHFGLMAQTRMQAALPFTAADKLETWRRPLVDQLPRFSEFAARAPVQLGGPIGNGASFGQAYPALRKALAHRLDLADSPPWHSNRTPILDVAYILALTTGTLGKIGQDVALMAQTGVEAVKVSAAGGSSAMAHKRNPVAAEIIVSLARFQAGSLGTLAQALVHENERSGAAWTLEWLVLPGMAETLGAALAQTIRLVAALQFKSLAAAPLSTAE